MSGTPTYPIKTIAKLLMLSVRRVQQLSKEDVIPRAERGRYELAPAVQGYIRYLQDRVSGNASQVADIDYHKEKARKIRAEADMAEMEAAKRRGDVIDAREVTRAWQLVLGEVRANLLNNTPARIASLIQGLESEVEVKAVIKTEIGLAMKSAAAADVEKLLESIDAE